jgi:hypothetical protein
VESSAAVARLERLADGRSIRDKPDAPAKEAVPCAGASGLSRMLHAFANRSGPGRTVPCRFGLSRCHSERADRTALDPASPVRAGPAPPCPVPGPRKTGIPVGRPGADGIYKGGIASRLLFGQEPRARAGRSPWARAGLAAWLRGRGWLAAPLNPVEEARHAEPVTPPAEASASSGRPPRSVRPRRGAESQVRRARAGSRSERAPGTGLPAKANAARSGFFLVPSSGI